MSRIKRIYDKFLIQHIHYVKKAYKFLLNKVNSKVFDFSLAELKILKYNINNHDKSKYQINEYFPYGVYFYGEQNEKSIEEFHKAQGIHRSRNPHHHEYWLKDNTCVDNMQNIYIFEMVCDWLAFAYRENDINEIFDWYSDNKSKLMLSDRIFGKIEEILKIIKEFA